MSLKVFMTEANFIHKVLPERLDLLAKELTSWFLNLANKTRLY